VQESVNGYGSPVKLVTSLAQEKANEVAARVSEGVIVGADTVVVLDGKRLGKPRDAAEARDMLRSLSGEEHCVYTGFALLHMPSRDSVSDYEVTRVKFRNLSAEEIDAYVKSGSCFDKAGAYGIQDDFGAVFVERIDGCYYNVVGFPLTKFYLAWQKFLNKVKE
jgi:septum formation protein